MFATQENKTESFTNDGPISVKDRQAPLFALYNRDPDAAWIIDSAKTSSTEVPTDRAIYGHVTFGMGLPAEQPIGVHKAVGGESDFPNPGEVLAAAIASCLDSSTRMIANRLGIGLKHLEVSVDAKVDVRGTLRMHPGIPVGFQQIEISVNIEGADGVTDDKIAILLKAAETSCVLIQTLRNPPEIHVQREPQRSDSEA